MKDGFFDMTPAEIRKDIAAAEDQVRSLRTRLETAERQCGMKGHNWDKVQYTPIETKGYRTQGDPPGTMGVDWQGPMWVEPTCTKQWTRMCKSCGKTETTQRTRKERMAGSVPGTSGEIEVPDFGDRGYGASLDTGHHWDDKDYGYNRNRW